MSVAGTTRATAAIAAVLSALAIGACGGDDETTSAAGSTTDTGSGCQQVEAPAPKDVKFSKPEQVLQPGETATATVDTSCGSFTITLDTKNSPKTANSFAFLAEKGVFDGTTFHRVAP